MATAHVGLHRTALAYCLAMAALVAVAAGSLMLRRRGPATGQGASVMTTSSVAMLARYPTACSEAPRAMATRS